MSIRVLGIDVVVGILANHLPSGLALGADVDHGELLVSDMVESDDLLVVALWVLALVDVPLGKSRVVDDVLVQDQLSSLGLQVCSIDAVVELIAFLSTLNVTTDAAPVDEYFFI